MTELSEREKIYINISITIVFIALIICIAAIIMVATRHLDFIPSWETWKGDDWVAFVAAFVILGFLLNLARMIWIKDIIKRLESDLPFFAKRRAVPTQTIIKKTKKEEDKNGY